ncbi:MAG: Lrp/AsnC family transcriptional regulator [Zavarzinia sp.]|nr:Lrp/AsnC family transcriptional regulator [Zavarzinia sp.]
MFDAIDRKIINLLQENADLPIAQIAQAVGLSQTPCWRRIKRLEEEKVIVRRVALIDRRKANVPLTVFVGVRAPRHAAEWLGQFKDVIRQIPEITEAYRLAGETDYLLKIVIPGIENYDAVYNRLIRNIEFFDITASIVMEEMKHTTSIPTNYMA